MFKIGEIKPVEMAAVIMDIVFTPHLTIGGDRDTGTQLQINHLGSCFDKSASSSSLRLFSYAVKRWVTSGEFMPPSLRAASNQSLDWQIIRFGKDPMTACCQR